MRFGAAHNWPQRFRPWLGETRVRLGFGPSGEAASERRTIEVPDVFADSDLEDWQEVAAELGFRALIALPLQTGSGPRCGHVLFRGCRVVLAREARPAAHCRGSDGRDG